MQKYELPRGHSTWRRRRMLWDLTEGCGLGDFATERLAGLLHFPEWMPTRSRHVTVAERPVEALCPSLQVLKSKTYGIKLI
jgi:hypothetical protein